MGVYVSYTSISMRRVEKCIKKEERKEKCCKPAVVTYCLQGFMVKELSKHCQRVIFEMLHITLLKAS